MTHLELLRLARVGALVRLEAIEQETQAIARTFPGLRASGPAPGGSGDGRRSMSAAARQAVSFAQKRRWAKWRKARTAKPK